MIMGLSVNDYPLLREGIGALVNAKTFRNQDPVQGCALYNMKLGGRRLKLRPSHTA
jgi:hypothetical protein